MGDEKIRVSGEFLDAGITKFESKLGLKEGFFKNLLQEDDWSFVIKLHALIEAVCTGLLTFHFNEPKLDKIFSRLELSDKTKGKIVFLKEIGLIGEFERKYVAALSEIRNKFVHNVRNCEIELKDLVNSYDKNQLKNFAVNLSPFESKIRVLGRIVDGDGKSISRKDEDLEKQASIEQLIKRAKEAPKLHIWLGANNFLIHISDMHYFSDYKQWEKAKEVMDRDDDKIW